MSNNNKTPAIRFKGFTDTWEQRKLGDTVQITMGQSPDGSTYSDVPSDYILVQGNADLQNGWVSPRVWTSQMTKKADAGDLIMSVRAPAGAMGKTAYNAVIGRGVAAIKGNEFIYQLLEKMDSDGYWKALSCGSTFESLNSDNIKNADVLIPDVAEQEKIGEYFLAIDRLITLHQRKCDKLIQFKAAMLKKMFPPNGADKPEIRFKGFTDAWEHCKLNETVKSIDTGKSIFHSDSNNGEYAILGSTSIIGYDDCYDYDGDFILTARVGANAGSLYRYTGKAKISDNTVFIQAEKNIDFVYYMLTKFDIKQLSFGTGQPLVKASELKNLDLKMPSKIEEQQKIGSFFSQLDSVITLHQCKCDKYKSTKAGLIRKLFP